MKFILLSLTLVFNITTGLVCQEFLEKENELDDLPSDKSKVNLLIELGKHYSSQNYEKALLYLQEALVLSTESDYPDGIANSFLWQGRAYYYKDEYALASIYLEKARRMFEASNDLEGLANYHFASGSINNVNGNLLLAIQDFQKAVEISKLSGNRELESLGFASLGTMNLQRSENDLALQYYREALIIAGEIPDQGIIALLLTNIGMIYEKTGLLDSALYYMQEGLEIRSNLKTIRGVASSGLNVGSVLMKMGKNREAVDILQQSQKHFTELNDDAGICIALMRKAEALNSLGQTIDAQSSAESAILLAKKIRNDALLSEIYSTLASMKATNDDYQSAFNYLLLHNRLKDSLNNINKERVLSELEFKFQTASKDDKIQLLKKQNEMQRKNNILLLVSMLALAAILVLLLILFRLKSFGMVKQKKLHDQENTIRQQESDLKDKEQLILKENLEARNREMASKALEMLRVNETIESIVGKLDNFSSSNQKNEKLTNSLQSIVSELEAQLKNNSWNEFERIFNNIHSEFFTNLLQNCPDLTPSEIKIAALLKINLNTKEIAALTYKSESGIKSTRFRLRKKLGLNSDDSLVPYLMQL